MLQFETWHAPPPLSLHVRRLWWMKGEGGPADWLTPDVGGADIALYLGAPGRIRDQAWFSHERFVVGGLSRALVLEHPAFVDVVGIQLSPGCACVLGTRAATLRGIVAPLSDVSPALDASLARWVMRRARGGASLAELAATLESHVEARCDRGMGRAGAAIAAGACGRLEHLAAGCGLSPNATSRRFFRDHLLLWGVSLWAASSACVGPQPFTPGSPSVIGNLEPQLDPELRAAFSSLPQVDPHPYPN